MPTPGERLGDYTLRSALGEGGFGSVWLATRPNGHEVALKILHPDLIDYRAGDKGPTVSERFLAEAELLRKLRHPGLVQIYDVIELRKRRLVAYAMERLHGQDLAQSVATLDLRNLLEAFAKVADTLAFLHEHRVVHRDVKASNIFITRPRGPHASPQVKLLDFGVAKELHADAMLANTATGMFMGSVRSMPPEAFIRWDGGPRDPSPAVDQWSLGVALYACLSGVMPFSEPNVVALIQKIENERPARLVLEPRYGLAAPPPEIAAIVDRCLSKRPEQRFADMDALAAALRAAADVCGHHPSMFGPIEDTLIDGSDLVEAPATVLGAPVREARDGTLPHASPRDATVPTAPPLVRPVYDESPDAPTERRLGRTPNAPPLLLGIAFAMTLIIGFLLGWIARGR